MSKKTLKKLKALGIDLDLIPDNIKNHSFEICTGVGFSSSLEIGFLLGENTEVIKELIKIVPPLKITTSKQELLDLRTADDDSYIPFSHFNPYFEDNVFYCIYSLPLQYALTNLV